jgi:hypothetical protein
MIIYEIYRIDIAIFVSLAFRKAFITIHFVINNADSRNLCIIELRIACVVNFTTVIP